MKKFLDLSEVANEFIDNAQDDLHATFLKELKDFSKS